MTRLALFPSATSALPVIMPSCTAIATSMTDVHPLDPVRQALAHARLHGVDFATAWVNAMVLVDASGRERRDWLAALEATAAAWEAAYDRQPTDSFAAAASMLATATSDHHDHERVAA